MALKKKKEPRKWLVVVTHRAVAHLLVVLLLVALALAELYAQAVEGWLARQLRPSVWSLRMDHHNYGPPSLWVSNLPPVQRSANSDAVR